MDRPRRSGQEQKPDQSKKLLRQTRTTQDSSTGLHGPRRAMRKLQMCQPGFALQRQVSDLRPLGETSKHCPANPAAFFLRV